MTLVLRGDPERAIPPVVMDVLEKEGWIIYDEDTPADEQPPVNLFWKTNRFFPSEISSMSRYPYQRVNHYPRSSEITKKDLLYRHMRRMKGVHGSAYDFVPVTFALPTEYVKFCQYFADQRDVAHEKKQRDPIYICKPSELSRGRKIFCFSDIGDLTYDCSSVVQEYVANPLLLHRHKADFRIYVLVACFRPLRAYIFTEGLARMSVEEYTLDDVRNVFAHLTNYSINKNSEQWGTQKDGIGEGCKWDFKQTKDYFASVGVDWDVLFDRIECLVCLTLLSISNNVNPVNQCFELYGFDVLFDCNFKPWLMEVNFSPALAVEADVDERVKEPLIRDIVATLGIEPFPTPESQGAKAPTSSIPTPPKQPAEEADKEAKAPKKDVPTESVKSSSSSRVGRPPVAGGTQRKSSLNTGKVGTSNALQRSGSSTGGATRKTTIGTVLANAGPTSSSRLRASSSTGTPAATRPSVPTRNTGSAKGTSSNRSATEPVFVDKAAGKFKTLFPFSSTSEELNKQMMSSSTPEKLVREIVTEIRKRDQKNMSAINSWAKKKSPGDNEKTNE